MDIEIGSNHYRNAEGTIEIEGVPQLVITLPKPDGPLRVDFVVFDEVGLVTAKVVGSSMAYNERRALNLSATRTSLVITQDESDTVLLKVELMAPSQVAIPQGTFITAKGHKLSISPTEWQVDQQRMSGKEMDVKGGNVEIG